MCQSPCKFHCVQTKPKTFQGIKSLSRLPPNVVLATLRVLSPLWETAYSATIAGD